MSETIDMVTNTAVVQKILSGQASIKTVNVYCDLDFEIFRQVSQWMNFFAVPLSDWPLGLCVITHLSLTRKEKSKLFCCCCGDVFKRLELLGNISENPTTVVEFCKMEITHTYFSISNSLLLLVKEPQSAIGFWCSVNHTGSPQDNIQTPS